MSAVIDSLARHLQQRVNKAEPEVERLRQRIAELEAALREIEAELIGAHDGGCILPVREIVDRALRKE